VGTISTNGLLARVTCLSLYFQVFGKDTVLTHAKRGRHYFFGQETFFTVQRNNLKTFPEVMAGYFLCIEPAGGIQVFYQPFWVSL